MEESISGKFEKSRRMRVEEQLKTGMRPAN